MHLSNLLLLLAPLAFASDSNPMLETPPSAREMYDAAASSLADQQRQFLLNHPGVNLQRRASLDLMAKHAHSGSRHHVRSGGKIKVRRPKEGNDKKHLKRACVPQAAFPSPTSPASSSSSHSEIATTSTQAHSDIGENHLASPSSSSVSVTSTHMEPSPSPSSGGGATGDWIFPLSVRSSWTTAHGRSGELSYNDGLKPLTAGKLPSEASAPDGSWSLQASYPAGTVKYSSATGHGYSFYTLGAHNGVDVTTATEVIFTYSVYFSQGFDFVKGGKLPGLYGGANMDVAKSCSGGRQDERDQCFSARLMWRTDGAGEAYNYFPISGKQPSGYCSTAPKSVCDVNYGDSIGRGSFYFPSGQWTTVSQRLRLNSPASESNGEQEIFVNGQSILKLTGLQVRMTDDAKIYGIMAQTFFGGSDQSWASPKDQWAWFKDWSLGVVY